MSRNVTRADPSGRNATAQGTSRWSASTCVVRAADEVAVVDVGVVTGCELVAEDVDPVVAEPRLGAVTEPDDPGSVLASMGNYIFTADALVEAVTKASPQDGAKLIELLQKL